MSKPDAPDVSNTSPRTLDGRVCMVTGATAGIGYETALGIARQGATVVIVGRNIAKCRNAAGEIMLQTGNSNVDFLVADLSRQKEIRHLAEEFKARYSRLHVLVNNAGGLFLNGQMTSEGIEMTLALNHLGYFLLTNLLLDTLKASAPARIVNVSSLAHDGARIDCSNLQFAGWKGYRRSKLANVLFTYELARRLEGTAVAVNALSPGLVASNFGANNRGLFPVIKPLVNCFAVSNREGAHTSIYLASSPEVEGVTGKYFEKCREKRSSEASYDRTVALSLWQVSSVMTGQTPD